MDYNRMIIIDRISKEAEDKEQLAQLAQSELVAYDKMLEKLKPYSVIMWERAIPVNGYNLVGELYKTEEDVEDDYAGKIKIKSSYKDGKYITEYEVFWSYDGII